MPGGGQGLHALSNSAGAHRSVLFSGAGATRRLAAARCMAAASTRRKVTTISAARRSASGLEGIACLLVRLGDGMAISFSSGSRMRRPRAARPADVRPRSSNCGALASRQLSRSFRCRSTFSDQPRVFIDGTPRARTSGKGKQQRTATTERIARSYGRRPTRSTRDDIGLQRLGLVLGLLEPRLDHVADRDQGRSARRDPAPAGGGSGRRSSVP